MTVSSIAFQRPLSIGSKDLLAVADVPVGRLRVLKEQPASTCTGGWRQLQDMWILTSIMGLVGSAYQPNSPAGN